MIYFLFFISILIFGCDNQPPPLQDQPGLQAGECFYLPNRYIQSIDGDLKTQVTYDRYCLKQDDQP